MHILFYVLDTNVLLVPFDATKSTIQEIKRIFLNLKGKEKLYIPARVARELLTIEGRR